MSRSAHTFLPLVEDGRPRVIDTILVRILKLLAAAFVHALLRHASDCTLFVTPHFWDISVTLLSCQATWKFVVRRICECRNQKRTGSAEVQEASAVTNCQDCVEQEPLFLRIRVMEFFLSSCNKCQTVQSQSKTLEDIIVPILDLLWWPS